MDIHSQLGSGFMEIVYEDALEHKLQKAGIFLNAKKNIRWIVKKLFMPHKFYADFAAYDKIFLEIKAITAFANP